MNFHLDFLIHPPNNQINYSEKILLIGSCFTEHIGSSLKRLKFPVLMNPNGILFDPLSITESLTDYINRKKFTEKDLNRREDIWFSWKHHGRFSGTDKSKLLNNINESIEEAHGFLKNAKWLILTFGTAYSYQLIGENYLPVANCHKIPQSNFSKKLLSIEEIQTALDNCFHQLRNFNPDLNIILTVSPVRHIKDGIIENNRSKARLLEAAHHLEEKFSRIYYFPAYELVIDVLRDYRFFESDLVHPNQQATGFVFNNFLNNFFDKETREIATELEKIISATEHKPFHKDAQEYKRFIKNTMEKIDKIVARHPWLNFDQEKEKLKLDE